ncbi:MAG: CBS domain-containing protein [Pseudomonadota bacterium]
MLVRDRMSKHPVTIRADADYKKALSLMQDHAMHHVPVLDAGNRLAGVLAERDLLLAATHYLQSNIEVAEVMHRNVVTVSPDMPISEAAKLMVNHNIGGLPVVDGEQHVVGIITESDIFRAFVELLGQEKSATLPRKF